MKVKPEMPEFHTKLEQFYQGFICGVRVNWDTCNQCKHFTVRSGWADYCKASEDFARELTALLKTDSDLVNFLTPEEAKQLMYCFINESFRRYGKVNKDAPMYQKLVKIAGPVLLKVTYSDGFVERTLE